MMQPRRLSHLFASGTSWFFDLDRNRKGRPMEDLKLAKSQLLRNDLNFVLVRDSQILAQSKGRGISPIHETYKKDKGLFKAASVADRVIGKAAAMFLIAGGITNLYTDLISDIAVELLQDAGIQVEFKKRVPVILNQAGDDLCPMEKIASKAKSVEELIRGIDEFFRSK